LGSLRRLLCVTTTNLPYREMGKVVATYGVSEGCDEQDSVPAYALDQ